MKNYKNILLKLSGEALSDKVNGQVYDNKIFSEIFQQVNFLVSKNINVSIVVGGGNIWRGEIAERMELIAEDADYMGMLATSINALALTSYFNKHNLKAKFINSLVLEDIASNSSPIEMKKLLNEGFVIIFGGGTGKPFYSTDTAASLRAIELSSDAILVAKNNADGVYDKDPNLAIDAKFIEHITYDEIINLNLEVIDHSALELLRNKNIDLIIFNMNRPKFIENLYNNNKMLKTIVSEH